MKESYAATFDYLGSMGFSRTEAINIIFESIKMRKRGWEYKINGGLVEDIQDLLGLKDNSKRLGFVLYWLYAAYRQDTWLSMPMNERRYLKNPNGMTYTILIKKIIKPLIDMGYLDHIKGNEYAGLVSRVKPTDSLIHLFKNYSSLDLKEECILIKKSTGIVVKDVGKKQVTLSASNPQYRKMVRNLNTINSSIRNHSITLSSDAEQLLYNSKSNFVNSSISSIIKGEGVTTYTTNCETNTDDEKGQHLCGFVARIKSTFCIENRAEIKSLFHYHRVFNQRKGDKSKFRYGGRFYCEGSQLPNRSIKIRDGILIDDAPTIELDYANYHARMIAAEQDITWPQNHDVYTGKEMLKINGSRQWHKKCVNALLNCSSRDSMYRMMNGKGFKNESVTAYIEAILKHSPFLKGYLGTDAGVRLQRTDSDICEEIMLKFISETNDCILAWHDSWRVKKKYEQKLEEIMLEVWDKRYPNTNMEIK